MVSVSFVHNRMQLNCLAFGVSFFVYLVISIIFHSLHRTSILTINSNTTNKSNESAEGLTEVSKFGLKDFLRFDFQNGKPVWEIKATNADYLRQEAAVFIQDAAVKAYRKDETPVYINANSARLEINGVAVKDAQLEGDVKIVIDDSLIINAEHGVYSLVTRKITIPGEVKITGPGYLVTGRGLSLAIDDENVNLSELVRTKFEEGAEAPKNKIFNK